MVPSNLVDGVITPLHQDVSWGDLMMLVSPVVLEISALELPQACQPCPSSPPWPSTEPEFCSGFPIPLLKGLPKILGIYPFSHTMEISIKQSLPPQETEVFLVIGLANGMNSHGKEKHISWNLILNIFWPPSARHLFCPVFSNRNKKQHVHVQNQIQSEKLMYQKITSCLLFIPSDRGWVQTHGGFQSSDWTIGKHPNQDSWSAFSASRGAF